MVPGSNEQVNPISNGSQWSGVIEYSPEGVRHAYPANGVKINCSFTTPRVPGRE